ncbi:hypothetical protein GCK72_007562 [Caenorhabditis remanei]|uniref:BTB domain-containing protein n=1 Tax=Caenorhabditis remanei TaxID=31234 RepID=A0A6A5HMM2_CAERE|nr:hypothetical protein GCK72_007562 [Caenorhabditis remanei]KAF1767603.1 hypothetical protein GCK72_007562 [Caenorhabditis remanei]
MNYIPLLLFLVLFSTVLGTHHSSHSPVKLDIGGTVFKTTRQTLTKHDGSFKTMLEADTPVEKDDNGCIFIDRDPRHFPSILNYLRDGYVRLPNSEHTVREILREAKHYKLEGLKELCEAKLVTGFSLVEKNNQSTVVSVAPVPQYSVPVEKPKLHNGTLRVIESESDYLNIIAYPTKHVMIFYYAVNGYGRCSVPTGLNAPSFVEKHKNTIDIYFRAWQAGSSAVSNDWLWTFFYKDYSINYVPNWSGSHKKYMQEVEETIAKFLVDKPLS